MKVSQISEVNENGFKPITITIESSKEAAMMWARLNINDSNVYNSQKNYKGIEDMADVNSYDLWKAYHKFYTTKPRAF